jgi:BolA protein
MSITDEISEKLQAKFQPTRLEIIDESEQHRGHGGYQEGGESHFQVVISAPVFAEMSRLQRHREIHAALGKGIIGRIHALSIDASGA